MGECRDLPAGEESLTLLGFGQVDLARASGGCWVTPWESEIASVTVVHSAHTSHLPRLWAQTTPTQPSPVLPGVMGMGQALGRVWLVGAALLAGSPLLAALLELNNRRGGDSNQYIVLRPDRLSIDGNRPPLSCCSPQTGHPEQGASGAHRDSSLSPRGPCLLCNSSLRTLP